MKGILNDILIFLISLATCKEAAETPESIKPKDVIDLDDVIGSNWTGNCPERLICIVVTSRFLSLASKD